MNKKNFGENFFRDPRDPRPKKISDPARAGPAGPAGSPKVVKIVPLGSITLLKRSGTPMVHGKGGVDRPVTPPLAKVMTKTRFSGLRWAFWPVLGASRPHDYVVLLKTGKNGQKLKIS